MSEGGGFLRNFRFTLASSPSQWEIAPVWPVAKPAESNFYESLTGKLEKAEQQMKRVPDALSPQTTQSSRTPPEASFMPERLRREVVSFIPERLSAPPRSKLSAMLN